MNRPTLNKTVYEWIDLLGFCDITIIYCCIHHHTCFFFYCCHMVNKYINKPDLMFSMYSCTSVQPVYTLTGGLRVRDVTQSFSSLLLYARIYSCHSSPTSSTGHNMPHWHVLIKSLRCHHNLTFLFLSPHSSFSWENKTTPPPPITPHFYPPQYQ